MQSGQIFLGQNDLQKNGKIQLIFDDFKFQKNQFL